MVGHSDFSFLALSYWLGIQAILRKVIQPWEAVESWGEALC